MDTWICQARGWGGEASGKSVIRRRREMIGGTLRYVPTAIGTSSKIRLGGRHFLKEKHGLFKNPMLMGPGTIARPRMALENNMCPDRPRSVRSDRHDYELQPTT